VFNVIKECISRDYTDGNPTLRWDNLKKKFIPGSFPSIFNTERTFRQSKLEKGGDLEIWITNLEELHLKLEDMDSQMTESHFMVQVLNSLANDYGLQVVLMGNVLGIKKSCKALMNYKKN
jgi:hypothetical protein